MKKDYALKMDHNDSIGFVKNHFFVPQKKEINACLSNTFGFGGHNACLILTKL